MFKAICVFTLVFLVLSMTGGGDMVDIDPEAQRGRHAAIRLPGFTAGMLARSEGTSSAAYVGKFSWIRG